MEINVEIENLDSGEEDFHGYDLRDRKVAKIRSEEMIR